MGIARTSLQNAVSVPLFHPTQLGKVIAYIFSVCVCVCVVPVGTEPTTLAKPALRQMGERVVCGCIAKGH